MAISSEDLVGMVQHWLAAQVNGYLGSGYGSDTKAPLQQPNSSGLGDAFIAKMLNDIPVLRQMPRGTVNVYFETVSKDRKRLLIEVGDVIIPSGEIQI